MADQSKPIQVGSIIHLQNGSPNGGYLDTRGRVSDKPAFWNVSGTERTFVSTHGTPNRDDSASGSWRVVSGDGKPDGAVLTIGDSIHLLNLYPDAGYLDCCGWIEHLAPFQKYKAEVTCGVFTSGLPNRDNGTGKWTIRSVANKKNGGPLLEGDAIYLENGYFVNGHPSTGFLIAHGNVTEHEIFKEYAGQRLFVFTSTKNKENNQGSWTVTLRSSHEGGELAFDYADPRLLSGRKNNMKGVMNVTNVLLRDALQAVSGIASEEVVQLIHESNQENKVESDQRLKQLLDKAKSGKNQNLSEVIDHEFQIKQLLNLFALTEMLNSFESLTLDVLRNSSSTKHQEDQTFPPLYLFRNCFRRTVTDHEIIQQATVQRRWVQNPADNKYYQSDQARELLVMDKLAIKAVMPFRHLLQDYSAHFETITFFSETTHIHHMPYTNRFVLVGVSYDRISPINNSSDDTTLTEKDFSAFELMAIPHEVGHFVYQVGKLKDGKKFTEISRKFKNNPYYHWCEEIFADVYGCIIAGPLSVFSMQAFLTSSDRARTWKDDEEHPTPALRSYILSEILRVLTEKKPELYNFSTVPETLDKKWTEVLNLWGFEQVNSGKDRPTRIYLPDNSAIHLEKIINVDKVLASVRPIIQEFATHLLATAQFEQSNTSSDEQLSTKIPWSQGDHKSSKEYAKEMAQLAGGDTARKPVLREFLLDIKTNEEKSVNDESDADECLQGYLDNWGDRGPHGWGNH